MHSAGLFKLSLLPCVYFWSYSICFFASAVCFWCSVDVSLEDAVELFIAADLYTLDRLKVRRRYPFVCRLLGRSLLLVSVGDTFVLAPSSWGAILSVDVQHVFHYPPRPLPFMLSHNSHQIFVLVFRFRAI